VSEQSLRAADSAGFGEWQLTGAAQALCWLAYRLPVGSPIRAQLTTAYDLVQARTRHPEFLVNLGTTYEPGPIYTLLGLPELGQQQTREVDGWLVLATGNSRYCRIYLRPSGVRKEHADRLRGVVGAMNYPDLDALHAVGVFDDPDVRTACAATAPEATDPQACFQDPAVSVPELLIEVTERHGLSPDAATLYLQLLALPDPTDANVARWTGWKPARLKKARTELAGTDLVLTAKRARAGRTLFLPGGWLALKDTHLPIEEWKKPMFRFREARPMGPLVPLEPVAALFRRAWQRVLDDDAPGYEELKTGRRK
jgi:hypothetical protein